MGLDLLDLIYRIEHEFSVELDRDEVMQILHKGNTSDPPQGAWTDIRVRDFVSFVKQNVSRQNPTYDGDIFEGVKRQIADCLMVDEAAVTPDAWMVRDLGAE